MFGCSKVYECDLYTDSPCSSIDWTRNQAPLGMVRFKASTQEGAESSCLGYVYETYTDKTHMGFDTTFTIYPECCNCDNYELAIFGSDYVN